ncbi:centromere protein Chl4/mis15/CENP-N [Gongronella butleri]|nr:centromere protein Chl4/mis15/CENP-N [Gongronella butleri]
MDQLSPEDSMVVPWQALIHTRLKTLSREQLQALITAWYDSPELRPASEGAELKSYNGLTKVAMVNRLAMIDYPDGLTLYQYSQLEKECYISKSHKRHWRLWRLRSRAGASLETNLAMHEIRERLRAYLSTFFKTHVLAFHHEATGTNWYRVMAFVTRNDVELPRQSFQMIHFPHTEYVIYSQMRGVDFVAMRQAVVRAFGASTVSSEPLSHSRLEEMIQVIQHRTSLGRYASFRHLKDDVQQNPLIPTDERPLAMHTDTRDTYRRAAYLDATEDRRRIVPVQSDVIKARFDSVDDTFGHHPLEAIPELRLRLRVTTDKAVYSEGVPQAWMLDDELDPFCAEDMDEVDGGGEQGGEQGDVGNHDDDDGDEVMSQDVGMVDVMMRVHNDDKDMSSRLVEDDDGGDYDNSSLDVGERESTGSKADMCQIEIKIKGSNVMEGLRKMAIDGQMDTPLPEWMASLASSGSSDCILTRSKK